MTVCRCPLLPYRPRKRLGYDCPRTVFAAMSGLNVPSQAYVYDFLATTDGLALTKAFMQIKDAKLRRRIVNLVEEIAG